MSKLVVREGGRIEFIYCDELLPLLAEGESTVQRVSHVEPLKVLGTNELRWTADLRPVNGPVLGSFGSRQEALAAEVAWLEGNIL